MTDQIDFKYTFPISKAIESEEGIFLEGFASGPETDLQGEEMSPEAILDFSSQINEAAKAGEPIPYRDYHAKDGALRDLGTVVKAWVNERFHLGVRVKLDADNPASVYLHRKILNEGKKYGMSLHGNVPTGAFRLKSGVAKSIRQFMKVNIDEISHTSMPVWYPSFGTVLAKAVDDAAAKGDNVGDTTPVAGNAPESVTLGLDNDTTTAVNPGPGVTPQEVVADIDARNQNLLEGEQLAGGSAEKAAQAIDKDKFAKMTAFMNLAQELGLTPTEPITTSTEKSQTPVVTEDNVTKAMVDEIRALRERTEQTETLMKAILENTPAGGAPGVVQKADVTTEVMKALEDMTPEQRLRFGLEARGLGPLQKR